MATQTAVEAPIPTLDLSRQYASIADEVSAAVLRVCASQHYILGEEVTRFEKAAAQALHATHGIGCASGTDALWLALAALNIGPGDAVITTPFTFFASASSITRVNATPVFVDIEPDTFNLDPQQLERALASHPGVKAIMPIHLYGQCADMTRIGALARAHRIPIVEDAAQAFGAAWNGTPAGALGDIACFSFYPTKNLSAYGDGGLCSTSDDTLAERMRMLRNHGSRQRYYHDEIGWNSRLDSMQAAVLNVKLPHLNSWNEQRQQRAAYYRQLFADAGLTASGRITLPVVRPEARHIYHQFVVRAHDRDGLRRHLTENKIGTEVYYPVPLHLQKCFGYLGYKPGDLPVSEQAALEVLALPIFPELTPAEQERVVETVAAFYR